MCMCDNQIDRQPSAHRQERTGEDFLREKLQIKFTLSRPRPTSSPSAALVVSSKIHIQQTYTQNYMYKECIILTPEQNKMRMRKKTKTFLIETKTRFKLKYRLVCASKCHIQYLALIDH